MIKINLKYWLDTTKVILGRGIKSFSSEEKSHNELHTIQTKEDFLNFKGSKPKIIIQESDLKDNGYLLRKSRAGISLNKSGTKRLIIKKSPEKEASKQFGILKKL